MLIYDMKRVFLWKRMFFGAVFMIGLALAVRLDTITEILRTGQQLESGWSMHFLTDTLKGDAFALFLPVLCSLPYASSFVDEYQSGIIKFAIERTGRRSYLLSKVLTVSLSGGFIVVFGVLTLTFALVCVMKPLEIQAKDAQMLQSEFRTLILICIRYFSFGALGASVGQMVSAAVGSRYMAWLSPFMAEYLLIILYERYVPDIPVFYPRDWLNPPEYWPLQGFSACIWMWCLIFVCSAVFVCIAKRRLLSV